MDRQALEQMVRQMLLERLGGGAHRLYIVSTTRL